MAKSESIATCVREISFHCIEYSLVDTSKKQIVKSCENKGSQGYDLKKMRMDEPTILLISLTISSKNIVKSTKF